MDRQPGRAGHEAGARRRGRRRPRRHRPGPADRWATREVTEDAGGRGRRAARGAARGGARRANASWREAPRPTPSSRPGSPSRTPCRSAGVRDDDSRTAAELVTAVLRSHRVDRAPLDTLRSPLPRGPVLPPPDRRGPAHQCPRGPRAGAGRPARAPWPRSSQPSSGASGPVIRRLAGLRARPALPRRPGRRPSRWARSPCRCPSLGNVGMLLASAAMLAALAVARPVALAVPPVDGLGQHLPRARPAPRRRLPHRPARRRRARGRVRHTRVRPPGCTPRSSSLAAERLRSRATA